MIDPKALLALIDDDDALIAACRERGLVVERDRRKVCRYCGEKFSPTGPNQQFCTPEHRRRNEMKGGKTPQKRYAQRSDEARASYNAYHREYQSVYRQTMTPEQIARHNAQKLASYHRRMARIAAVKDDAA